MRIIVNMLNSNIFELLIEPTDTIISLKIRLYYITDIMPEFQTLIFAGRKLKNKHTIADYNIRNNNTLLLIIKQRGNFQVYIKRINGNSILFDIIPGDKIITIKQRLEYIVGIPAEHQRLVFNGTELLDDMYLMSYNIKYYASIYLLFK